MKQVAVVATKQGVYGIDLREPGDVFLVDETVFSHPKPPSWFRRATTEEIAAAEKREVERMKKAAAHRVELSGYVGVIPGSTQAGGR